MRLNVCWKSLSVENELRAIQLTLIAVDSTLDDIDRPSLLKENSSFDLHRPKIPRRHDFATFAAPLSLKNRIKITKSVLRHAPLIIQSIETVAASLSGRSIVLR